MYLHTISPELKKIIESVFANSSFKEFSLCGGTALSLQTGHRVSLDADFISEQSFDSNELIKKILVTFPRATDVHSGSFGLFLKINSIKVDFLSWNIPFIREIVKENNFRLLHIEEIIAMKLFAILQRGEKKDYMDIASLVSKYSLKQMLGFYRERHKVSDSATVLRFLASYSDLENQPVPTMLNSLTWEQSKIILASAIKDYLQ